MVTYTTISGDTWDGIAYKLFGNEKYMTDLILANWRLLSTLVFSAGIVLSVPDVLQAAADSSLPFWRVPSGEESR